MTHDHGIVAVTEDLGPDRAGAMVWWRLSGTTDADVLRGAWNAEGLPEELLPDNPSAESALRRAVMEQREKSRMVRQCKGVRGWGIIDEQVEDGTKFSYQQGLTVTLDEAGRLSFDTEHPLAGEIRLSYYRHMEHLEPQDVSGWLVRMADKVKAVALREGGGVYFIPREHLAQWRQMVKVLKQVSAHRVHEVPALRSREAIEAIMDAITLETESVAKRLEEDLATVELGPRALRTRVERCSGIEEKVRGYETLLGTSLDVLRDKLGALQSRLAQAALAAEADAEVRS